MSYRKRVLLFLSGIMIGTALSLSLYYVTDFAKMPVLGLSQGLRSQSIQQSQPRASHYHFVIDQGILAVVEGLPGEDGRVVLSGLDVKQWPQDILLSAPRVEFDSLDEVQSFIDTVSEPGGME